MHFSHLSRWILSCGIMSRKLQTPDTLFIASPWMGDESHKKQEESILLYNTDVAPGQAHSQLSLFTE